jgi:Zn-dependent membrane protease YugP
LRSTGEITQEGNVLGAGITLWAQWKVQSTYKKYAQVRNVRNMTGLDVARVLMRNEGLDHVRIEQIGGELTDHYDPRAKAMRLSAGSIAHPSVAAMAVVAHELGHALRARAMLERYGLVTRQEAEGVKAVLDAAALTYVAAAATAILQMLYYVSLLMRRR